MLKRDLFILIVLLLVMTMQLRIFYLEEQLELQIKLNTIQSNLNIEQNKISDMQLQINKEILKRIKK